MTNKVDCRIQLKRKEQAETLQSHWLALVSINSQGPFLFAVEPSRCRTLVSARTVEGLGLSIEEQPRALTISDELAYPLLRLESLAVGSAVLNDFEIVVWGRPVIPPETLAEMDENIIYPLGSHPLSVVDSIMECRGILGLDFLHNFRVSFDFNDDTLILQR